MMKLMSVILGWVLFAGLPVSAQLSVVVTEDFESGVIGETLDNAGWLGAWAGNEATKWETADANSLDPNDSGNKIGAFLSGNPSAQIYKRYNGKNVITDSDADVWITGKYYIVDQPAQVRPRGASWTNSLGPAIGVASPFSHPGSGFWRFVLESYTKGYYDPPVGTVKEFTYGDPVSFDTVYELLLQIQVNQVDITQSTGTLYYRNLTLGETMWTKDSFLQDINLYLTSTNKPSLWLNWHLRLQFRGGWDDLQMGTGLRHVCDPNPADLNGDCEVNFLDLAVMAGEWLDCLKFNPDDC